MIIKKSKFKYSKKGRRVWPFNVPEVAIVVSTIEHDGKKLACYGLVHNFKIYALSAILINYGLPRLEESGIWIKDGDHHRSLTEFYKYLIAEFERKGKL